MERNGEVNKTDPSQEPNCHSERSSAQSMEISAVPDSSAVLATIRDREAKGEGKQYWRSLEELAGTPEFEEFLHREFPKHASEWIDAVGRRTFLKLMGASLALAGMSACTKQPAETIVPYVRQPEEIVPGRPLYFATATVLSGVATGVIVESHEGRPTKIDGNPNHPGSLGAADVFSQATILDLYDPDRAQTLTFRGEIRTWGAFLGAARAVLTAQRGLKGAGLRILTETVTSPTLAAQIQNVLAEMPQAKWHQYEPVGRGAARVGARMAFGEPVTTVYDLKKADVILSLGADFLTSGPGHLRYAREFAERRRVQEHESGMNRLYVVESTPSSTGAKADHRLPLLPSEIGEFARRLAVALDVPGAPRSPLGLFGEHPKWIEALARDLKAHRGRSVVIPGDQQSPATHALAHAINAFLGNVESTVNYLPPIEAQPVDEHQSLAELMRDIDSGQVDVLIILGGNPVYNAPADMRFKERLEKVGLRIRLSHVQDETSEQCHWHVPEAHPLEAWSDARAFDGTVTIIQPLIAPLYRGKNAHELLAAFTDQPERSSYEIVREYWSKHGGVAEFEPFWRKSLNDGVIAGSAFAPKKVSMRSDWSSGVAAQGAAAFDSKLEIQFQPDPSIYDGRFANNGWLQELPKPLTKLTWDNAVLVSPDTATRLGLNFKPAWRGGEHGEVQADVVELRYDGRAVRAPIWIVPGQAENCLTVQLGYGRKRAGRVGNGAGFNAFTIRRSDSPWFGGGLEIRKTGERYSLACTQFHFNMEGRDIIRAGSLEEYRRNPSLAPEEEKRHGDSKELPTLYPAEHSYPANAWGMAIDLNACIGCNACVVACQSENNIPVVGKEQVIAGREMHWIRLDRYYSGNLSNPEANFQPVPCMQCENAPCELVCPVGATVHSAEGLNDMVYNRCVGTRYCSNNCPYKVRRFNFLLFQDWETPTLKLMRNPDVTVRSRGVMEKCTYCVQRINRVKIEAEKENRSVRDGEVVTACEAVCPAQAIVFGNINDPQSRVARQKAGERNYALLADLNARPRTTYLGVVRNPNPELEKA